MGSYKNWYDADSYKDLTKNTRWAEDSLRSLGMRYGLDPDDYQPEDTGSQEAWDPDGKFRDAALTLANNDYDYRRATEAARLSAGNIDYKYSDKKWSEMTDKERDGLKREEHMDNKEAGVIPDPRFADVPSSINSMEDVFNVNKFMRDTYDNENLGDKDYAGPHGSSEQRAAVTDYYVNLDRSNLLKDVAPKDDQQTEVALEPPTPVELSDREITAKERVDNHSYTDVGMALSPDGRLTFPSVNDNSSKASTDFLDDYKFNVKQGLEIAGIPTRGPGSVGTVGGLAS